MANSAPATCTVTSTTGPGQTVTAIVLSNVVSFAVDFVANTMRIGSSGANGLQYFDYSAMATLTWTITAGRTSVTVSS